MCDDSLVSTPTRDPLARISDDERRRRLARRHHLIEPRTDDVVQIATDLVALHSSDPATVYLSVLARMNSPRIATVDEALYSARSLVRHHAMRRTMWVMTPSTARRPHAATTEKIARSERTRTLAALGDSPDIDDPAVWYDAAEAEVIALLRQRPMTAREVGDALPHLAVPIVFGGKTKNPAALNAHTKVLQGAAFNGRLVRAEPTGSWTSSEYRWVPAEVWLDRPIVGAEPRAAAAELLDHWLQRFGPATETDIRWWFGWTATAMRTALGDAGCDEVALEDGRAAWVASGDLEDSEEVGPWVRILPGLDPTSMGWKTRDWYLEPSMLPRLVDRFGNIGPTIWADGRIVGGWIQRPDGAVAVELLAALSSDHRTLLDDAIDELVAAVGGTVVKPRFPAPNQRDLA